MRRWAAGALWVTMALGPTTVGAFESMARIAEQLQARGDKIEYTDGRLIQGKIMVRSDPEAARRYREAGNDVQRREKAAKHLADVFVLEVGEMFRVPPEARLRGRRQFVSRTADSVVFSATVLFDYVVGDAVVDGGALKLVFDQNGDVKSVASDPPHLTPGMLAAAQVPNQLGIKDIMAIVDKAWAPALVGTCGHRDRLERSSSDYYERVARGLGKHLRARAPHVVWEYKSGLELRIDGITGEILEQTIGRCGVCCEGLPVFYEVGRIGDTHATGGSETPTSAQSSRWVSCQFRPRVESPFETPMIGRVAAIRMRPRSSVG